MNQLRLFFRNRTYTEVLLTVNIILYLSTVVLGLLVNPNLVLIIFGALAPEFVLNGEVWRLITHAFLHANNLRSTAGVLHIFFNMYFLWQLGPFIERFFSKNKFIFVYLAAGIGGGLMQLGWSIFEALNRQGNAQASLAVGASGAIFGLLGLLLGHAYRTRRYGVRLPLDYNQLYFVIAVNLVIGLIIPNVSNAGHIGGLITGFLLSFVIDQSVAIDAQEWKRTFIKFAAPALILLTALAFVAQALTIIFYLIS